MRKITEIPATIFKQSTEIHKQYRVAAYCRVSTDKEEQEIIAYSHYVDYQILP